MRILESTFLLISTIVLILRLGSSSGRVRWSRYLSLVVAAIVLAHLLKEGWRWQMVPGYVVAAGTLLAGTVASRLPRIAIWSGFLFLGLSTAAGLAYPVFAFPTPSGPMAVGTMVQNLVDRSRQETRGPGPRQLMIQVWYPADASAGSAPAPYLFTGKQADGYFERYQALVKTHAFADTPVRAQPRTYSVLIYSPSWHGERYQNTFLMQELASHGFIVVAIDHPYGSAATVFPDGRVVRAERTAFTDTSSEQALRSSVQNIERELQVRTQDVIFVLDALARFNQPDSGSRLAGRLDLSRIGVLGFSFGGAVAAEVCHRDSRFRAGLDMDGDLYGEAAGSGVQQPFLFMDETLDSPAPAQLLASNSSQRREAELDDRALRLELRSVERFGGYRLAIRGTEHDNFTDAPLISPLRFLTHVGPLPRDRSLSIMSTYALAFFGKHLNQTPQPLLDGPSREYPEVQFQAWTPAVGLPPAAAN